MQPEPRKSVMAIAAHPDDIEFVMAGTLLQLAHRGWQIHYMNIANGCCGSMEMDRLQGAAVRLTEAQEAARLLPATFHPPICDDMAIFYTPELLAKVSSAVRLASPSIILTHSPIDYMEDHETACRLAVSAAFVRGMPNCHTDPVTPPVNGPVTIYHAQPHGNKTPMGETVVPSIFVDIESVMEHKRKLLECHRSQQSWLDQTQGMSSYIQTMYDLNRDMGKISQRYNVAEGWRRRNHLGFCEETDNPLVDALKDCCIAN